MSNDWCCWVLTYRVEAAEHRLFLPLVGREAKEVIEDAREDGIGLLFTSAEDDETPFEAHVPALSAKAAALLHRWRSDLAPSAPDRLLQTMDILLSSVDEEFRQVPGPPRGGGVTVVMPEDLQRDLSDLMPEFTFS